MDMELQSPQTPESNVESFPTMVHNKWLFPSSDISRRADIPDELLLPKWTDDISVNKRPMFHIRPRPTFVDPDTCKKTKMDDLWVQAENYWSLNDINIIEEERRELPILFQDKNTAPLFSNKSSIILKPRAIRKLFTRFHVDDRETENLETKTESLL